MMLFMVLADVSIFDLFCDARYFSDLFCDARYFFGLLLCYVMYYNVGAAIF